MADWKYDDDEGLWIRQDGWTYDPVEAVFELNEDPVSLDKVPEGVRGSLEATAKDYIDGILGPGQQHALGNPVPIDNKFNQGVITNRVVLGNQTFGSDGATPCLIVFATGTTAEAQQVAVGAHLDDDAIRAPETTVETMIENLGDIEGNVAFSVYGGEVGRNTNPGGGSTMDYSRYYPFFLAIEQNATMGGYNFPSNGTGDTATGAAITKNSVKVWHDV